MVRGEKETLADQQFMKNTVEAPKRQEAEFIHSTSHTSRVSGTQFKNDVVIKTKQKQQ